MQYIVSHLAIAGLAYWIARRPLLKEIGAQDQMNLRVYHDLRDLGNYTRRGRDEGLDPRETFVVHKSLHDLERIYERATFHVFPDPDPAERKPLVLRGQHRQPQPQPPEQSQ